MGGWRQGGRVEAGWKVGGRVGGRRSEVGDGRWEVEGERSCVPIGVQASTAPVRGQLFGCEKSFSLEPIVAQTSDQPTRGTAKGLPRRWNRLSGMGEVAFLRRPIAFREAMLLRLSLVF